VDFALIIFCGEVQDWQRMVMSMNWKSLLNVTRVRSLYGGAGSFKSPDDPRSEFERDYGIGCDACVAKLTAESFAHQFHDLK
jgi:hypothetical protein